MLGTGDSTIMTDEDCAAMRWRVSTALSRGGLVGEPKYWWSVISDPGLYGSHRSVGFGRDGSL
jgi:hypothetical protein